MVLETNLGNALEKKRAGCDLIGLAAQHGCDHTRVAMAQRGPRPEGPPRAHVLQRTPGLTGYYAAPLITIAQETCFTLRTLELVTFVTGRSPSYPRATAWHTGSNGGYAGRARPTATGIKGRPPSMAKPASMDGGWELSDVLPGDAAASG